MFSFNFLKKIKSFSVILLPDDTSYESKSLKVTLFRTMFYVVLYTILTAVVSYYVLQFTGIGKVLLPGQDKMSEEDSEKIEELNDKIFFLAKELQSLKSSNERLKYALILGDSTIADSVSKTDSSDVLKIPPVEGNILGIVFKFLNKENSTQTKDIFFIKPVDGFISRKFDPGKGHPGIDIVVKEGTPVFASAGGFIIFADYTIDFGYTIIINHVDGYITVYKHCSSLLKKQREIVEQGELIALSGNSGYLSTGPHLHFEIWKDGISINPESILTTY
jgi:murein DD-endopeptidase MepM/ murein hydrolase activator NlpD